MLGATAMPEKTYTTREVALILGVTVQTVQRWVDAGHLRAWRTAGGHRRLSVDSVDAFVRHSKMQLDGVAPPLPASNESALPTEVAPRSPQSILVVDDDEGDREIAIQLIRGQRPDIEIVEADNGFSGLIQLGRRSFDAVLTDITMPHLDGLAMLRTVKDDPALAKLAIAAMSSYSKDEIIKRGGLPPDVAFFPKPLRRDQIAEFLAARLTAGAQR
jgi:excisionase family DNA binding protein